MNKLEKEALIKHISELYKKYKYVKEYFDYIIAPNKDDMLTQYMNRVHEGFYPLRGNKLRLSVSKKAISDFRKLGSSKKNIADLLLYYVECGVEFTDEYRIDDDNFYTSIENTYEASLKLMHKEAGVIHPFNSIPRLKPGAMETAKRETDIVNMLALLAF